MSRGRREGLRSSYSPPGRGLKKDEPGETRSQARVERKPLKTKKGERGEQQSRRHSENAGEGPCHLV